MAYTEEDVFGECASDKKQLVRVDERVYKQVGNLGLPAYPSRPPHFRNSRPHPPIHPGFFCSQSETREITAVLPSGEDHPVVCVLKPSSPSQVWLALCKWIVDLFDRGKGVNIITLMQLMWVPDEAEAEIYGGGGDVAVLRPVWRLSEGFEKSHRLSCKHKSDQRRPEDALLFTKSEEINFHKLAMRYSKSLTKDQCFSALRDMFRRIGQALSEGKDVKVFFGVGDLCGRDRKAHFVFDGHYHRFIKKAGASTQAPSERGLSRASSRQSEVLVVEREGGDDEHEANISADLNEVNAPGSPSSRLRTGFTAASRPATTASREIAGFFSGVPADDTWRYKKVQDRLERIRKVDGKMWEMRDKSIEKTVDFETRNMLLGEHRRVAGEEESELRAVEDRKKRFEHAGSLRTIVKEREREKKKQWQDRRHEPREDPFYVHLEPLEESVVTKKKKSQEVIRLGLEEQIAARIKTAQDQKHRTLLEEQVELDRNAAKLRKTLTNADIVKMERDQVLKGDWAMQRRDRAMTRALDSTINKCLTEKMRAGTADGRASVESIRSRPSTGLSARFIPLSRGGTPMGGGTRLSSSARMSLSRK